MTTSKQDSDLGCAMVEWIADNLSPDDIFDENTLREWAVKNGYIHSDDLVGE